MTGYVYVCMHVGLIGCVGVEEGDPLDIPGPCHPRRKPSSHSRYSQRYRQYAGGLGLGE